VTRILFDLTKENNEHNHNINKSETCERPFVSKIVTDPSEHPRATNNPQSLIFSRVDGTLLAVIFFVIANTILDSTNPSCLVTNISHLRKSLKSTNLETLENSYMVKVVGPFRAL
jgi:hypothetical protein